MNKLQVKISEIQEINDRLNQINRVDLSNIDFLDDQNNIVKIDTDVISKFKLTGLLNTDFITSYTYLEK